MQPIVFKPGGGPSIRMGNAGSTVFKVEGPDTAGAVSITENVLAPGFPGPVLHMHRATFDMFYVIEGSLTVRLADREVQAPSGSFVCVPPGVAHTFSNPSAEPVRLLNIQTPAGLEQYLKEVAAEMKDGPPDPARMAEIVAKHDFVPVD